MKQLSCKVDKDLIDGVDSWSTGGAAAHVIFGSAGIMSVGGCVSWEMQQSCSMQWGWHNCGWRGCDWQGFQSCTNTGYEWEPFYGPFRYNHLSCDGSCYKPYKGIQSGGTGYYNPCDATAYVAGTPDDNTADQVYPFDINQAGSCYGKTCKYWNTQGYTSDTLYNTYSCICSKDGANHGATGMNPDGSCDGDTF